MEIHFRKKQNEQFGIRLKSFQVMTQLKQEKTYVELGLIGINTETLLKMEMVGKLTTLSLFRRNGHFSGFFLVLPF